MCGAAACTTYGQGSAGDPSLTGGPMLATAGLRGASWRALLWRRALIITEGWLCICCRWPCRPSGRARCLARWRAAPRRTPPGDGAANASSARRRSGGSQRRELLVPCCCGGLLLPAHCGGAECCCGGALDCRGRLRPRFLRAQQGILWGRDREAGQILPKTSTHRACRTSKQGTASLLGKAGAERHPAHRGAPGHLGFRLHGI